MPKKAKDTKVKEIAEVKETVKTKERSHASDVVTLKTAIEVFMSAHTGIPTDVDLSGLKKALDTVNAKGD